MKITKIDVPDYEHVVRCDDPRSGLRAIIAVHNTSLGPALGGMRMYPYKSDDAALTDVLRLARGMTFKSAIAETGLGGGKSVILGDPKTAKTDALLESMARFVDSQGGRYITAEDSGTNMDDMVHIRKFTQYVTGLPREMGSSGDPSPFTALGTFLGMRACIEEKLGTISFENVHVALQGVGHVGMYLLDHLFRAGAQVTVCDVNPAPLQAVKTEFPSVRSVDPDDIYDVECDIFSPNAMGAIVNTETIPRLRCSIVAGAANNQLREDADGLRLRERGILYAPDYVINAGGIINVSVELEPGGYDEERSRRKVNNIYNAVKAIIETSKARQIPTAKAAHEIAMQKLAESPQAGTRQAGSAPS